MFQNRLAGLMMFAAATLAAAQAPDRSACATVPSTNIRLQLAKFHNVEMGRYTEVLTPAERGVVEKLIEASRYIDSIFWRQNDSAGLALFNALASCPGQQQRDLRHYLLINGGRYDLLAGNAPFVETNTFPPGRDLFPHDITAVEIERYVARQPSAHDGLYGQYSVVKRQGLRLVAVPYHLEYARWLVPAAKALEEAAALTPDSAFARFLRLRAAALKSDDYYQSDLAWLDLEKPKVDIIFAPYETYLDGILALKTSYGAAVMIRDEGESAKLAIYEQYVTQIQAALPLAPADRPSSTGHRSPMEVMNVAYRGGDLRHGYQSVADNLPNDPRIHALRGSKKLFFKNYMDARVDHVVLPIGRLLLRQDQATLPTKDAYFSTIVMHEICHGVGPAFSRRDGKTGDMREAIGPSFGGLEEAKADIVGLFALDWFMAHGVIPRARANEFYVSHVAGIFRTVRFGVAEAHARGEMMQFNYFSERGAIIRDTSTGRYFVDFSKMKAAVASLAKELLEIEASGDRRRSEAWFTRYGAMPGTLRADLDRAASVPVDFDPVTSFDRP